MLADTKVEGKHQGLVAVAEFGLARVLAAEGRRSESIAKAEQARTVLTSQANPDAGDLARIDAWLRERGVASVEP